MIRFLEANIENTEIRGLGPFDLVLCLGLLYHLENPFYAVRNLFALTGRLLIIETEVVPSKLPISILREEVKSEDQGLSFIAFVPSVACLVKMLYKCGFKNIYRTNDLPEHPDFKKGLFRRQQRTCLIASKSALNLQQLVLIPNKSFEQDWWCPWWFRKLIGLGKRLQTKDKAR